MALKEKIMTNEQQQFAISTGKGNMGIVSPLSVTWPQLTARLSAPKIGSKEGSFWCPASFATNSRKLENVKAVALIVLDVEQKATTPPPLRDALMACSGLNWTAFAHTSYKHTVQSPRYRLILQPDRPIEPGQLRAVVTAVADRLGLSTCTDLAASRDAARLYFLPRVPHAAAKGLFECDGYEGTTVGLDSLTAPASHALMPVAPQAPADAGWDVGLLDAVEKAASGKPAPDRQRVVSDLRDALRYLSPDEYADWIAGGHDLYRLGADGEALWTEWSMRSPKWKPTDAAKWASFKDTHSDYPAIFKRAQQAGWRNPASSTRSTTTAREDFQLGMAEHAAQEEIEHDHHRNAPRPSEECLYGLVGDVGRAAHEANREVNPFAAAATFMTIIAAAMGRGVYLPIGDDSHHARLFFLHVGRSGRGRKGSSSKLPNLIMRALKESYPDLDFQIHTGGLSSREGLVLKIHDGYGQGKNEVPAVVDKRLWILESEFANVLHQAARDGNTLSAALRDAWDGTCIKPATKTAPISTTRPHINLMGHITPSELMECMKSRELSNGFANRFLIMWAEQTGLDPFPRQTPDALVKEFADRLARILYFCKSDRYAEGDVTRMSLSPSARARYEKIYRTEFQDRSGGELVAGLMTRQAPMLQRMAMVFAATDQTTVITEQHLNAALAWVRYWRESVGFIFASANDEAAAQKTQEVADGLIEFLGTVGEASRSQIVKDCFKGRVQKTILDKAIEELLTGTPPLIEVEQRKRTSGTGSPTTVYRKTTAKSAKSAKCGAEPEADHVSQPVRNLRNLRNVETQGNLSHLAPPEFAPDFAHFARFAESAKSEETQAQSHVSHISQTSQGKEDAEPVATGADDGIPEDGVI
jgi:hypothetical protein